jgi:hypothetical protein
MRYSGAIGPPARLYCEARMIVRGAAERNEIPRRGGRVVYCTTTVTLVAARV